MRETFLDFADNLIRQENAEEIFTKLSKILAENMLFHEEGVCWEKILHINQNYELYRKIGDIFINKVGNSLVAFNAYNKYLQYTDPIFYNNYMNVAKKQGLSGFDADTEEFSVGMKLYDVFDAIVYMIICLLKNKDYEGVVQLEKKLVIADNNIKQYLVDNNLMKKYQKGFLEAVMININNYRHVPEIHKKLAPLMAECLNDIGFPDDFRQEE